MPKPLIITLKEGVDPVYGIQKALVPTTLEDGTLSSGNYCYMLMPEKDTYAKGVHALRTKCEKENDCPHPMFVQDDGSKIYRPLTFKENIEVRVNDFNTLYNFDGKERKKRERLRLFTRRWLDSCTGIAYKKGTTKFKLVPVSKDLITLSKGFNNAYVDINYDTIDGIELDRKDGIYDRLLTLSQVENHPAWLAAVDGDTHLLKAYGDIVFANVKQDTVMGFYTLQNTPQDQLRALLVHDLDSDSRAYGSYNLGDNGSFLLVAPVVAQKNNVGGS